MSPTLAGSKFFAQHDRDLAWVVGQQLLAERIKELSDDLKQSLEAVMEFGAHVNPGSPQQEAAQEASLRISRREKQAQLFVWRNHETMFEVTLCRYADNFLCYLSDLLRLIITVHPEALGDASSMLSGGEVFSTSDLDSLRDIVVERRVRKLSQGGLEDLDKYLKGKHKFSVITDDEDSSTVRLSIYLRNLLVHNRGNVDGTFLELLQDRQLPFLEFAPARGERVVIGQTLWDFHLPAIWREVCRLEEAASRSFHFDTSAVQKHPRMPSEEETERIVDGLSSAEQ